MHVDKVIGEEALKTLERHLWYLSDLTIPMALFSEKVDLDPRVWSRLAARLLALKNNNKKKKAGSQKLVKPRSVTILCSTTCYHRSQGSSSLSSRWTTTGWSSLWTAGRTARTTEVPRHLFRQSKPPKIWLREPSRRQLITPILTKDKDTSRRIIQGVKDHRSAYPDFKKFSLNK